MQPPLMHSRNQFFSCHHCKVQPLMCFWISFIVILDKNEEVPCSALFKKAHQRRLQSLHISRGNLVDLIEHNDRNKVICTSSVGSDYRIQQPTEDIEHMMLMKNKGRT